MTHQNFTSSTHQGDVNSVMASLAMSLRTIGLSVQWNLWSLATDSHGVVLRMSWEQHHNRDQGAVASGEADTGPRQAVCRTMRRKTPSKARRDRKRWEMHQAKRASSNNNVQGINAAEKSEQIRVMSEAEHDEVAHDEVAELRDEVCDDQTSHAVGPATVNVMTRELNVNAIEFQPQNTDVKDKDNAQIEIKKDTSDNSSQCDISYTTIKPVCNASTATEPVGFCDVSLATESIFTSEVASQSDLLLDYISNAEHHDIIQNYEQELQKSKDEFAKQLKDQYRQQDMAMEEISDLKDELQDLKRYKDGTKIRELQTLFERKVTEYQQMVNQKNQEIRLLQMNNTSNQTSHFQNQPPRGNFNRRGRYNGYY